MYLFIIVCVCALCVSAWRIISLNPDLAHLPYNKEENIRDGEEDDDDNDNRRTNDDNE